MITAQGIYDIPEAEYHADPVAVPSLSSGLARTLLDASPLHAWNAHPRLNPAFVSRESETFDLGRAAHALILEGREAFCIIDADDWRTKAAKEGRDAARAAGKTPLLASKWADIQAMAEAVKRQCADFETPTPFTGGKPEQTLVWEEDGAWMRARLDWLHTGVPVVDDLKTTSASANPDQWGKTLFGMGADFQAAFYCRGFEAVFGLQPSFRFVVCENYAPFACSVVSLAPATLALAHRKVSAAIALWRSCMRENEWPGYPTQTCYVEAPPWIETQWMEREMRDQEEAA